MVKDVKIGSNILAQKVLGTLNGAIELRGRALERLGSGLRIYHAADDPAGLAVSSDLQNKTRIFSRARLNVGDAISLLNIADSTLEQVSGLLGRMAELAAQASNGVFSGAQRSSLSGEYKALDREIRRITASAKFNGLTPLTGRLNTSPPEVLDVINELDGMCWPQSASPDGRYVAYSDGISIGFCLRDNETGQVRAVATPSTGAVSAVRILANGDSIVAAAGASSKDIYYYSFQAQTYTKLTSSSNVGDSTRIEVSADGNTVAFTSYTHYTQGGTLASGTTSGNLRLFTLNLKTGVFKTAASDLTDAFLNQKIVLSADGSKAAIVARDNPTGGNGDTSVEIFRADMDASIPSYQQLTNVALDWTKWFSLAGITDSGKVYASSNYDLTGENGSNRGQLFEIAGSGSIKQLTRFANTSAASYMLALSADESRLFFGASGNLTGENPNSYLQFFSCEVETGAIQQLSGLGNPDEQISGGETFSWGGYAYFSADGSRVLCSGDYNNGGTLDNVVFQIDLRRQSQNFDFETGCGAAGNISAEISALTSEIGGLGAYVLTSEFMARHALNRARSNIESLNQMRGLIGASMSRLQSAATLLSAQREEFAAANGRIVDADVALESAAMIRAGIIQNIGAALLAQANQQPELALQLLQ